LFTLLVYLFMFTPIAIVVILSFNDAQFGGFPIEGFSLRWFYALAENDAIVRAFRTSLLLGLLAAIIATTLGILACPARWRQSVPATTSSDPRLSSSVLLPEGVRAVGLLLFMRWLDQPRGIVLLLAGHGRIALPFVVLVVQARLVGIRKVYE